VSNPGPARFRAVAACAAKADADAAVRVRMVRDVVREVTAHRVAAGGAPAAAVKGGVAAVVSLVATVQVVVKAAVAAAASIPALRLRPPDKLHFADARQPVGRALSGSPSPPSATIGSEPVSPHPAPSRVRRWTCVA